MAQARLEGDPEWSAVSRMTLVCILASGEVALTPGPEPGLPSGDLLPAEHPLDACGRIPLEQAGFRYQHFHPLALDDGHLVGWVEGDHHRDRPVPPTVGLPRDGWQRALVADALADHRHIDPVTYGRENVRTLERAYLSSDDVRKQSGFGGDEAAWRARRGQVADAVGGDGTFLDAGCANGHLAESVVAWCRERGVRVEPYGVDLAPGLVDLARRRLPQWADRFWVGDALAWAHPGGMRFDHVHVLLDVVPERCRAELVRHHLAATVAPGGRLLVSHYGTRERSATDAVLAELGLVAGGWCPTHDPTRAPAGTAWLTAPG